MKRTKIAPLALAAAMALSMAVPAFADISTAGGSATVPVTVNATAATFSVTVPTSFPISVGADGAATGTEVTITNNGAGPVKITNLTIAHSGDWATVDYDTNYNRLASDPVGTKHVAVTVGEKNGSDKSKWEKTTGADTISFTASNWNPIAGNNGTMTIAYDTYIPLQSTALNNVEVAQLTFTIGWDAAA